MKKFCMLISLLSVFYLPGAFSEGIYKWTDENGQVHYGEKRPDHATSVREMDLRSSRYNTITTTPEERKRKQEQLLRALSEERQIREEIQAEEEKQKAKRKRACIIARDRLKSYEQANLLYHLNEKGERVFMSDADRDRTVAEYRRQVNEHCNQ